MQASLLRLLPRVASRSGTAASYTVLHNASSLVLRPVTANPRLLAPLASVRHLATPAKRSSTTTKAKKPAAKKVAATSKAAKPAAKKTATATRGRTAAKKAPARKTAATKKKAKPVKKAKKPAKELTPEQVITKKSKDKRILALPEEPVLRTNAYAVFFGERMSAMHKAGPIGTLTEATSQIVAQWRELNEAQKEEYKAKATEENVKRAKDHRAWVESLTGAEIRNANLARFWLKKHDIGPTKLHRKIDDPRKPVGRRTALSFYITENLKGKAEPGTSHQEQFKSIALSWQKLPDAQKKVFNDLAAADYERAKVELQQYFDKTA